jgi:hypothetical protein
VALVRELLVLALALVALRWLIAEVLGQPGASTLVMWAAFLTWAVLRFRQLTDPLSWRAQARTRRSTAGFEFHAELFEVRTVVLEALAAHGFVWLSDFGAVDVMHDIHGVEVTAIRTKELAAGIEQVLARMFPRWRHRRTYYEDHNAGELGWKVMISLHPEDCGDHWPSAG